MPKQAIDRILVELGRLVISWNATEHSLVYLLEQIVQQGQVVRVLGSTMRSEAICNAIRTFANEGAINNKLKPHVLRGVDAFQIICEYRNHYIHKALPTFGVSENDSVWMSSYSFKAKKKIIISRAPITIDELQQAHFLCTKLGDYLYRISACLDPEASKMHFHTGEPVAPPELLPMPDRLEKHLQRVRRIGEV